MASEEDWIELPEADQLRADMQQAIATDMKALGLVVDMVNHPPHYGNHPSGIECIEVTRLCMSDMGAAIQYIWRHADKGTPEQDLRKARWYLNDLLTTGQATICRTRPR